MCLTCLMQCGNMEIRRDSIKMKGGNFMGSKSGDRVRIASIVTLTILLLASVGGGFWIMYAGEAWIGLVVIIAGSALSVLLFIFLYAFGDMVSDMARCADMNEDIDGLLQSMDQKLFVLMQGNCSFGQSGPEKPGPGK